MKIEILTDANAVAHQGAAFIAAEARAATAARGRFIMAVSGGHAFAALVAAEGAIRCNKGGLTLKLRSVGAWLLWLILLALHIALDPVTNRVFR